MLLIVAIFILIGMHSNVDKVVNKRSAEPSEHVCNMTWSAVTVTLLVTNGQQIRLIFIFKGVWLWVFNTEMENKKEKDRIRSYDKFFEMNPVLVWDHFKGLPQIDGVDAAEYVPVHRNFYIARGRKLYVAYNYAQYGASTQFVERDFSYFFIPPNVNRIDAILFNVFETKRIYVTFGKNFTRLVTTSYHDANYIKYVFPKKIIDQWPGAPVPFDSAFTLYSRHYFVKDRYVYRYNQYRHQLDGNPVHASKFWVFCEYVKPEALMGKSNGLSSHGIGNNFFFMNLPSAFLRRFLPATTTGVFAAKFCVQTQFAFSWLFSVLGVCWLVLLRLDRILFL